MNATVNWWFHEPPYGSDQLHFLVKLKDLFLLREYLYVLDCLIFPYRFFIKTNGANTIATSPKSPASHHSTTLVPKAHHFRCILPFQKANHMRHSILGRDRKAKVDMVGHRMSLNDFCPFNPSSLLNCLYNYLSLFTVQLFSTIFGYPNDMILTIPSSWGSHCRRFLYSRH